MVVKAVREAIAHHQPWQQQLPQYFILTGDTAPERLQMANGLGATLLHKPIDPHALHARLSREWGLRQGGDGFSATLREGDPGHLG